MFQFDSEIFDSMQFEDYQSNNNIVGLGQIKDSEDCWIPEPAEIYSELPENLFNSQPLSDKMESSNVQQQLSPAPVIVKQEESEEENLKFDLINFIIGDVSQLVKSSKNYYYNLLISQQEVDMHLTPLEEKSEPIFTPKVEVEVKAEVPTQSHVEVVSSNNAAHFTRKRAPKRRYSSDSEFSVSTSVSSFTSTAKRQKKRGRPAKELITNLPTIDDFRHIPVEEASHLVLRIKNNEASRKSRMKSKSKQDAMEDECTRLINRRRVLEIKKNKYDGQIETLRRWLLGQN